MRSSILIFLLLLSFPCFASHYLLSDVGFITTQERDNLARHGLLDSEALLSALATVAQREGLAGKTGIGLDRLRDLAQSLDLMRLRGVGPKMVNLLRLAGIHDSARLSKATAEKLHQEMLQANELHQVSELVPDAEVIKDWIEQARKNPSKLR